MKGILAFIVVTLLIAHLIPTRAHADVPMAPFVPDGSKPMSPEHRALRDPQGHLDEKLRKEYSERGYCAGHVKSVIVYSDVELVIACYPSKTITQGVVISNAG